MITVKYAPYRDVTAIVYDKELYDRMSDDSCPVREKFVMPKNGYVAIGGYIDNKIASLFITHDGKLHFMVLKLYRKYARLLLKASFGLWPHLVYVEIPNCYMEVINFAKRYGFKEIKIEKKIHKKNGQLFNVHTLEYGA